MVKNNIVITLMVIIMMIGASNAEEFLKHENPHKVQITKHNRSFLSDKEKRDRLAHMHATAEGADNATHLTSIQNSFAQSFHKSNMTNFLNQFYIGDLFLGTPYQKSQLIYDTGSGWLVVKSEFCTDDCKIISYNSSLSTSATNENTDFTQSYGSADLNGKIFKDTVCLEQNQQFCVDNFRFIAIKNMLGLVPTINGIVGMSPKQPPIFIDGEKIEQYSLLEQLHNNPVNHAIEQKISFHMEYQHTDLIDLSQANGSQFNDSVLHQGSFSIFGGVDENQFVGSIYTFELINSYYWSLELDGLYQGGSVIKKFYKGEAWGVIDTGTTMIAVPDIYFNIIKNNWNRQLQAPDFLCTDEITKKIGYCQGLNSCSTYYDKLDPLTFKISDSYFEIKAAGYLVDTMGLDPKTGQPKSFCLFGITPLPSKVGVKQMFLFGDVFLRNYYSVFDLKSNTVGLALDKQSITMNSARIYEQSVSPLAIYLPCMSVVIVLSLFAIYINHKKARKTMLIKTIQYKVVRDPNSAACNVYRPGAILANRLSNYQQQYVAPNQNETPQEPNYNMNSSADISVEQPQDQVK